MSLIEMLKNDIDGYQGSVKLTDNEYDICEYLKALCDLMDNKQIQSNYLGIAQVINDKMK